MMKCPCKGCEAPKKKMFCHSHCEEYKAWANENKKKMDWLREENSKDFMLSEEAKRGIWKKNRWR